MVSAKLQEGRTETKPTSSYAYLDAQPAAPYSGVANSYDPEEIGISVEQSGDVWEGYNLFTMARQNRQTSTIDTSLFIMDLTGEVVASQEVGSAPPWKTSAELIDPNTVLVGTETTAALWHMDSQILEHLSFGGHHEYEYNPIDDTFFTLKVTYEEIDGATYRFDQIVEYDRDGTLVWSLNVSDFISEDWWCPYHDTRAGVPDISHANTIFYDVEEDVLYLNARNVNTFFKLNHSTGAVIWALGEYGDFTMFDAYGNEKQHLFFHAHSVERVENNTFILFDNDYHNQTSPDNQISRMLEITVNEATMTANATWFRNGPAGYYSAGGGDADRLPNGNRLGTFGYWTIRASGVSAALLEVDNLGNRVWRMEVPFSQDYMYGIYRAERFRMKPTLGSPSNSLVLPNTPTTLTWQAQYNFRNKARVPGIYELHIDGLIVQNGTFKYQRFWQPTNLSFDFSSAVEGLHNVTLFVSDGHGHFTNDTVNVYVGNYYVTREGPIIYEQGYSNSMIRWVGDTVSPLLCNVSVNGSSVHLSTWNGEDVLIDAASLPVGNHLIEFELFNGTDGIYVDSFWLEVHSSAPPVVQALQGPEVTVSWNDTPTFRWVLSDTTPDEWQIFIDGAIRESVEWRDSLYALNWTLPVLEEGEYTITLVAVDKLGQKSTSETALTVEPPTRIILASSPGHMEISWGLEAVVLLWEIHGATHWELLKDGLSLRARPF
ncbi:MAG: aryl-sulfate sulfotransferase, partial [Candidatus Hermodarchaeota archaeon]